MKRVFVIIGLAMLLCLAVSLRTMAAPSLGIPLPPLCLEATMPTPAVDFSLPTISNPAVLLLSDSLIPPFAAAAMGGTRYYMAGTGVRPFATIYGGSTSGGRGQVNGAATVGLEFQAQTGFRAAVEAGAVALPSRVAYSCGVSLGFVF